MKPAMDRAGLSRAAEQTELFRLMSTNTGMRMAGIGTSQIAMIIKDVLNQTQAQDPAQAYNTLQNDPVQAMKNLAAGWNNFQTAFGNSPFVVTALNNLADGFNWLANVTREHPNLAKVVFDAAAGIAVITAALGTLLTVMAPWVMLLGRERTFGMAKGAGRGVRNLFRLGGGAAAAGGEVAGAEETAALAAGLLPLGGLIIGGVIAALGAAWLVYKSWGPIKAFGTTIVDMIVSSLSAGLNMLRKELASLGLLPTSTAVPGGVPGKGLHDAPPAPPAHGRDTGHKDSHGHEIYQQAMNVNVYLDGQQIAATVTKHQVNALRGPNRGPGRFDDRQSPRNASDAVSVG